MPPKTTKKSTSTSSAATSDTMTVNGVTMVSERLQLAKAINELSKCMNCFVDSANSLKKYSDQTLDEMDLNIESKKKEYMDMINDMETKYTDKMRSLERDYTNRTHELENEYNDREIKAKLHLEEYRHKAAVEFLKATDEVPITMSELNRLRGELEELREDRHVELENLTQKLTNEHKITLAAADNAARLRHEADIATLKAQVEQQKNQIDSLHDTLDDYKEQVKEQRELTRQVAEASRQGGITQTIGKN